MANCVVESGGSCELVVWSGLFVYEFVRGGQGKKKSYCAEAQVMSQWACTLFWKEHYVTVIGHRS
jgi:hypothetical protein